jgi:hypothetical protein
MFCFPVEDGAQHIHKKRLLFGIGAVVVGIVLVSLIIGCAVASKKSNSYFIHVNLFNVFIPIFKQSFLNNIFLNNLFLNNIFKQCFLKQCFLKQYFLKQCFFQLEQGLVVVDV